MNCKIAGENVCVKCGMEDGLNDQMVTSEEGWEEG